MAIYLAGVVLSMLSTIFLRKTVLKGKTTPFVMELPPIGCPPGEDFLACLGKT